jgi:hypothetical protein
MTTDKKSCENCGRADRKYCDEKYRPLCEKWLRNPHKWLSILPMEPGWYWFKKQNEIGLMNISKLTLNEWIENSAHAKTFQWQGPITPNE